MSQKITPHVFYNTYLNLSPFRSVAVLTIPRCNDNHFASYYLFSLFVHVYYFCSRRLGLHALMTAYCTAIYTVSQKRAHFYILNNSVIKWIDLITFGAQNPEKISHQKIVNSPTLLE